MAQSIEPAMEILFVNGLAAAPFFILLPLARRAVPYNRIWSILGMSVALQLVLGVALSFIGAPEGRQLDSLNDGIGGTMGTANMFAMLCLLVAVRYAFFYRRGALFVGLGVLGVSLAGSLAAVGCLCVVVSVGLAMGHRASATTTKLVLGAVLLASLYFVLMKLFGYELALSFDHVIYKAESMWRVASGEGGSELSRSIELRLAGWTDVTHGVLNDLGVALFGRLGGGRYFLADSQVVTYVGSFGLPVALMILAPMLSSVHDLLHVKNGRCAFALQALLVIVFLLVNRMFDYFTGAALAALVVSEIRARSRGAVG
jgi:hypothetical protein